jgi:hypothetical protein
MAPKLMEITLCNVWLCPEHENADGEQDAPVFWRGAYEE